LKQHGYRLGRGSRLYISGTQIYHAARRWRNRIGSSGFAASQRRLLCVVRPGAAAAAECVCEREIGEGITYYLTANLTLNKGL